MFAAVETVTNADPVRKSRRHNPDIAAHTTAREPVHAASPLKSSSRNGYNERHSHCNCPLRARRFDMDDRAIRAALDHHWAASDANDVEEEHRIYREDAVLEYPQSGERMTGRQKIQASR